MKLAARRKFVLLELLFMFGIPFTLVVAGVHLSESPAMAMAIWSVLSLTVRGAVGLLWDIHVAIDDY